MIFKNNNHIIDYKVNNNLDQNYSISHHVNLTFSDNQAVLFDGKKGKGSIEEPVSKMPKHGWE